MDEKKNVTETPVAETGESRKKWKPVEYIGLAVFLAFLLCVFFFHQQFSGAFTAMFAKAYKMFEFYLFGGSMLGATIVVSIMTGRILERLGFTDALMRIFLPIMKFLKINAAVVVGIIYNILGDVNAAGKIAGPVVMKAGCTRDEQKIAIATLTNAPASFSIMVLGIIALSTAGINPFPVMIVGVFLPIFLVPAFLRLFWRDTKPADIKDLPRFTPNTGFMDLIFGSAREGVSTVLTLILPAGCAVYAIIGLLEYVGVWPIILEGCSAALRFLSIEPETGMQTITVAGTLAAKTLGQMVSPATADAAAGTLHALLGDPAVKKLIVGSYVLANSSWPIQVPLGQIPAVWSGVVDLKTGEIMKCALIGCLIRVVYACLVANFFGLFF
jgi:spore maturation protein SpmB